MRAWPIVIEPNVAADDRREVIESAVCVDDAEVVERILIVGVERLTERMEDSLERVMIPRSEKLASDNMGIANISSWMNCLVVIGVAVFDMGSRIGHVAPLAT